MAAKKSKSRVRPHSRRERPAGFDRGWMAFWALAAVVVAVGVALLAGREGTVAPPAGSASVPHAEVIAAAEQADPRIVEVERHFICPCGRCGGMELTECECATPGGALETKGAIVRLLGEGHDVDAVVGIIARRYGGLKPGLPAHGDGPGPEAPPLPASAGDGA